MEAIAVPGPLKTPKVKQPRKKKVKEVPVFKIEQGEYIIVFS
jgi:hypothetical protein